jgi:uncharacterized protein (DUF58 family)
MKNAHWFVIASLVLVLAFFFQSPYVALALYTFLLLVFLSHFSSSAWVSGLDCERTLSHTTLQQGEDLEVQITVTNRRGWPIPWIFFEDYHPVDFPRLGENKRLAILMPGRSVILSYQLQCPRRGYHRVGPILMESGDLFGLQKRFRTGERQDYVSVLPTIAYIDTFNIASKRPQGPVRISNRIYADPTRINSIRGYVPGDPLNTIHWKATARTGELQVKTFEASSVLGGTMVLDLHEGSFVGEDMDERMELAITTTASIAYLLQMSGEQVGMITNAQDAAEVAQYSVEEQDTLTREDADDNVVGESDSTRISPLSVPTLRSPAQAQQIIENLARVLPGEALNGAALVMAGFSNLPRDAALLVVTPDVSEEFALTLGSMKHAGFNVSVFLIKNEPGYTKAAELLAAHYIHVFHIVHEEDLHEISPAQIGR